MKNNISLELINKLKVMGGSLVDNISEEEYTKLLSAGRTLKTTRKDFICDKEMCYASLSFQVDGSCLIAILVKGVRGTKSTKLWFQTNIEKNNI